MTSIVCARSVRLAFCTFCVLLASCNESPVKDSSSHRENSRMLVQEFASRLQAELLGAIEADGPVGAIDVCKRRAPRIAAELSARSGAQVTRISRRTRNPANAPVRWQQAVLQSFDRSAASDETLAEYLEITNAGEVRYMKPIYIKPVCLACHGKSISPDIRSALEASYPEDKATGYSPDQLRGAFSVVWPVR